ncbi:iron ABC transporter permease [Lacisediminimonas sp.]|uniref:FecCD family ABC transporter permease n=1 Tax=Lacisediminimonas sp. TaxID=3060582 RepID=UPI0027285AF1|nr:iron ABC transporter permease [Lacisediminimonas sp.]MDO8298317.1 iron ABC transporter permease [Lacisediminimonas sp.]
MNARPMLLSLLAGLAVLALALGVACGSSGCSALSSDILWQLRLPRALAAFAVGALLALSGALMQVLLRNPLADPYVLGVSGGAAAGAMLGLSLFPALAWSLQAGALAGALLSLLLLLALAGRALMGAAAPASTAPAGVRLILTGVMIAAAFGALLSMMLAMAPDNALRGVFFWLLGDLESSRYQAFGWIVLVAAVIWSWLAAPQLNVLVHGDAAAFLLGVRVDRLRLMTLLVAGISTAAAVSVAGTVGFIGLVVPHAARLMIGNDQRLLLPACALAGGAVLVLADLVARTVVAPVQLPVGVITVLVGVPVFLVLLARSRT